MICLRVDLVNVFAIVRGLQNSVNFITTKYKKEIENIDSKQNETLKFNSSSSTPNDIDDVLIVFDDEGCLEHGVGYYDPEQQKWFLKLATNYMPWPTQYKIKRWASLGEI